MAQSMSDIKDKIISTQSTKSNYESHANGFSLQN